MKDASPPRIPVNREDQTGESPKRPSHSSDDSESESILIGAIEDLFSSQSMDPSRIYVQRPPIKYSVGVIGGGTAGYLTALALKRSDPNIDVTLIESSSLPVIGVGESTTPLMPQFLHGFLGIPVRDLFTSVQPTFKLGIKFLWGAPAPYYFNYPFGPVELIEPYTYDKCINTSSLYSMLMSADAFPITRKTENCKHISFLRRCCGYHLDNVKFVKFLKETAAARAINHLDAVVSQVHTRLDSYNEPEVASIELSDGRRHTFDLYIDCSGFRSILLGETLANPFISYKNSLFTDSAVIANVPNGGKLKPYTLAETMECGWSWNIPQRESDHRGYVYSSAFLKTDEAISEMRRSNPNMGEPSMIKFRSGRHQDFWRANVVAIGNSYAFVEPLESTALHMILIQIKLLLAALPLRREERGRQGILNRKVADYWDYIKWFLSLHYRYNGRLASKFWQTCRADTDTSDFEELVHYFREHGPLSYDRNGHDSFGIPDVIWGKGGIDVILLGQRVESHLPRPTVSRSKWHERTNRCRDIIYRCVPQADGLDILGADESIMSEYGKVMGRW